MGYCAGERSSELPFRRSCAEQSEALPAR
jgi:hypothetical protein